MKTPRLATLLSALGLMTASAAPLYFDQNGTTAGFGLSSAGTYDWDSSSPVWNSDSSGNGAGPLTVWSGSSDIAIFSGGGTTGYAVNLTSDVSVAGIQLDPSLGSNNTVLIEAASLQTITLGSGSVVRALAGAGRRITFGDNVALSGDLAIEGSGFVGLDAGPAYSGNIRVNSNSAGDSGLLLISGSRVGSAATLTLDGGSVVNLAQTMTVSRLSGAGGELRGNSGGTYTVNQSTDSTFSGRLGSSGTTSSASLLAFNKGGVGTLTLDGADAHGIRADFSVNGGAAYVAADFAASTGNLVVAGGATLGGTFTNSKGLSLSSGTSVLSPGMEGEAGTMTLANGITAASGGVFQFNLNGDDGFNNLVNSQLVLSDGTVSLGGTKTVNLVDLGAGHLETGVFYTLVDATSGLVTLNPGWDANWVLNSQPAEWTVDFFGFNGNELQVRFTAVPEPAYAPVILLLVFGALWMRRRNLQNKG